MLTTMEQTIFNDNVFAQRNMHPIVGGVLDKQDPGIFLGWA